MVHAVHLAALFVFTPCPAIRRKGRSIAGRTRASSGGNERSSIHRLHLAPGRDGNRRLVVVVGTTRGQLDLAEVLLLLLLLLVVMLLSDLV